jgi:hypothetical protein
VYRYVHIYIYIYNFLLGVWSVVCVLKKRKDEGWDAVCVD